MKPGYALLIAFGAPLLFVLIVVAVIQAGQARVRPAYDVLYESGTYGASFYVRVDHVQSDILDDKGNVVAASSTASNLQYQGEQASQTRFYRYNPATDSSTVVGGYAEAHALTVVSIDKSLDGYRISRGENSGSGFLFPFFYGGSGGSGFVIDGNGGRKQATLIGNDYQITIVGWIPRSP